jgi:hypothetical protein
LIGFEGVEAGDMDIWVLCISALWILRMLLCTWTFKTRDPGCLLTRQASELAITKSQEKEVGRMVVVFGLEALDRLGVVVQAIEVCLP